MSENPEAREPDRDVRALDRLVGTWRITGDAHGTIRYRWLDGGFFLVQEGEVALFGHRNRFTEVIGRERLFGGGLSEHIKSRTYTSEGDTLDYTYQLDDDTLTIWGGEPGSVAKYVGTFSADGDTLTGSWTWTGGGYSSTSTRQPDADESADAE